MGLEGKEEDFNVSAARPFKLVKPGEGPESGK